MNYEHLVADFAARTKSNLQSLREGQKNEREAEVYEVTQLINSMLGLLIFPKECYWECIPATPLGELQEQGWPVIRSIGSCPKEAKNLRQLVRYLRNAIAHCNIEFLADGMNQITGLRVWNKNDGKKDWEAELTLAQLEEVTERLIELLRKDAPPA